MRPRLGDPQFGPVCECGASKAKQARTCQTCHGRLRGYGTVPLRDQYRRWRLTYNGQRESIGDEDAALIARADRLEVARATVDGELQVLVAEQTRDERFTTWSRDRWMVSLDDVDQYGRSLHELIA